MQPLRTTGSWLAALVLCASCEPGSGSSPIPRLPQSEEVDPSLRQRLDELVSAVERDEEGSIVVLAETYDANGLPELALATFAMLADSERSARTWYHVGRLRAQSGRTEGALAAFSHSLELEPSYAPTHWRRGELLLELDRLDAARAAFQRAIDLEPEGLQAWLGMARVHLARGEAEEARVLLEPQARRHPRARFLHGLLARALHQTGDLEGAQQAMKREERSKDTAVRDPWTASLEPRAVGLLVTVERANEALQRGDAQQALDLLEPLDKERPGELTVQQLLARALLDAGQVGQAAELLERARETHPDQFKLELFSGQVALAQGALMRAAVHLERAAVLNPAYGPTQAALGETLVSLHRHEEAELALLRAMEAGSDGLRVTLLLARAELGSGKVSAARETLEGAAAVYRRAHEPWVELFELELAEGRLEAARAALQAAKDRDLPAARRRKLDRRLDLALTRVTGKDS